MTVDELRAEEPGRPSGLDAVFRPKSVAVIGASREATAMSGRLFRNLVASFQGPVYPINPNAAEIAGVRAFPTIKDVPGDVDLAFVAVPSASVLAAIRQCVEKGVRGLVVITAGFSETDESGKQRQRELVESVRAAGLRMIGPNCFGVFNTDPTVQLHGTFAGGTTPHGNIGIASQSGALGIVIPEYLRHWKFGASMFASIGNKADVTENDLLRYWRDDSTTDVIVLYLESFADPREFRELAAEISPRKPIVVLKAARTQVGARAASSHTAALASPDRAADALFAQSGVLRVTALSELFDVSALLASQPLPRGRRVAVLTNAGGPGILCADALAARGLTLPEFSRELQAKLRSFLHPEVSVRNPIDLIATIAPTEFRRCLELVMASQEVDAVVTIYVPREPGTSPAVAQAVREVAASHGQELTSLAVFLQLDGIPEELRDETTTVPGFLFPEAAAGALAHCVDFAERRGRPCGTVPQMADMRADQIRGIVDAALKRLGPDGGWLGMEEVLALIAAGRFPLPRWRVVHTAEEATAVAREWQTPLAVKVISPTLLHKTDAGGVLLDIRGEAAARTAFAQVLQTASDARGVLLQEFVKPGHETLIGLTRDARFGHLVTFGLGGVLVELLDDVACRLHPLTDRDADEMLRSLRTAPILTGYRNRPGADTVALRETLLRVSQLATIVPEIAEMDLNPVIAYPSPQGVCVVDARIRLSQNNR